MGMDRVQVEPGLLRKFGVRTEINVYRGAASRDVTGPSQHGIVTLR
jgi:hypothetical protein